MGWQSGSTLTPVPIRSRVVRAAIAAASTSGTEAIEGIPAPIGSVGFRWTAKWRSASQTPASPGVSAISLIDIASANASSCVLPSRWSHSITRPSCIWASPAPLAHLDRRPIILRARVLQFPREATHGRLRRDSHAPGGARLSEQTDSGRGGPADRRVRTAHRQRDEPPALALRRGPGERNASPSGGAGLERVVRRSGAAGRRRRHRQDAIRRVRREPRDPVDAAGGVGRRRGLELGGLRGLEKVKDLLGVPAGLEVLAILPFGYPARPIGRGQKQRKALREVAHVER